ncbi:MAG: SPOR domain-containing protein [Candidatus Margulisiibacteriota bacterium]|jgi:cell division protein FtsN
MDKFDIDPQDDNLGIEDDFFQDLPGGNGQDSINEILEEQSSAPNSKLKVLVIGLLAIVLVGLAFWASFNIGKKIFAGKNPLPDTMTIEGKYSKIVSDNIEAQVAEQLADEEMLEEGQASASIKEVVAKKTLESKQPVVAKTEANPALSKKEAIPAVVKTVEKPKVSEKPKTVLPPVKTPPVATIAKKMAEKKLTPPVLIKKTSLETVSAKSTVVEKAGNYLIVAGSFRSQNTAEKLIADLKKKGFAARLGQVSVNGQIMYRAIAGTTMSREDAAAIQERAKSNGYGAFIIRK